MAPPRFRLVIGDKAWSSWSLRPWLAMARFGIPFEEETVLLRLPDTTEQLRRHSPSGKVPLLMAGDFAIWDSLAILEYLAEDHPSLWPADRLARTRARSVSAEMHSSFQALRGHCPMDILATNPMATLPEPVAADVRRVVAIWRTCRSEFGRGGTFLFGAFSAADAMFAPVASRFRTYVPDLAPYGDDGTARDYVATIFAMPEIARWCADALAQLERRPPPV
jgi:glutathione S-transferase